MRDFPDPLNEDTDGDGERDGDEDANRNCMVDAGETDPRVVNAPPAEGTEERIQFEVCSAQNVKGLTFAESIRLDYLLAFEVERNPDNSEEAEYFTIPFGFDGDGLGFNPLDTDDTPIGHIFQSPAGVIVDPGTMMPINRDIYGFIIGTEDGRPLDVILDELRGELETFVLANRGTFSETAAVTSRPAHDDLPNARIQRAQREIEVTFEDQQTSVLLRNVLLTNNFLDTSLLDQTIFGQPDSPALPQIDPMPPTADLVYSNISCSSQPELCFTSFNISIAAVQRLDQTGVNGQPITLLVLALTPDDRDLATPSAAVNRLYPEKLIRLEDITGGSAVARFAAETGTTCEREQRTLAKADVLWVVDDSRSMQQIIDRLQQAANATQTVFTANSNIVDFRLAMTTTNPSMGARRICPEGCRPDGTDADGEPCDSQSIRPLGDAVGTDVDDGLLGCLQVCPANCNATCGDDGGTCDTDVCVSGCTLAANLDAAIATDAMMVPLPGGGGTFYYEDSFYMDCASQSGFGGLDNCGFTEYVSEFGPFYQGAVTADNPVGAVALTGNAGFVGADLADECSNIASSLLAPVDLNFDTSAGVDCSADPLDCCDRLIDVCGHGPTVLASQMCDLIRAMGGTPQLIGGEPDPNSRGRRPHSAPELGTLQARRVLENALPALPEDLADQGQLRLNCVSGDTNCPVAGCRPGETFAGSGAMCQFDFECGDREFCSSGTCTGFCDIVPVLTVFLSDEEDYYFKDECSGTYTFNPGENDAWAQLASGVADKRQLPSDCRYVDGDPRTVEACPPIVAGEVDYCDAFSTGRPMGYDP
ncbi:MAG: hypothetical protein AAF658_08045, partial [Myxococcota bacterium]